MYTGVGFDASKSSCAQGASRDGTHVGGASVRGGGGAREAGNAPAEDEDEEEDEDEDEDELLEDPPLPKKRSV